MSDVVINATLTATENLTASLGDTINTGVTDYNQLANRPTLDGITVTGNRNLYETYSCMSEGNITFWAQHPAYVPKKKELVVYLDYKYSSPAMKVGDGITAVQYLPFIDQWMATDIWEHRNDTTVHITAAERLKWNNKVSLSEDGETLIFTT